MAKVESDEASHDETAKVDQLPKAPSSHHPSYPFPVPQFPPSIADALGFCPASEGRIIINDKPDLDLIYFEPYIPKTIQHELFQFLRRSFFFYRVQYTVRRGPIETQVNTPRFTTVFGVDETSFFSPDGTLLDRRTQQSVPRDRYACTPRPIPARLDALRRLTEGTTGRAFNFCLVNYYTSGADSISCHSDDERLLGPEPAIASFRSARGATSS